MPVKSLHVQLAVTSRGSVGKSFIPSGANRSSMFAGSSPLCSFAAYIAPSLIAATTFSHCSALKGSMRSSVTYGRSIRPCTEASIRPGRMTSRLVCPSLAYSSPSRMASPRDAASVTRSQRWLAHVASNCSDAALNFTPPRTRLGRSSGLGAGR